MIRQRITPFLWFNDQAEEAVNFYCSIFKNSSVNKTSRYGEGGPGTPGQVMTMSFTLDGQEFIALNGGPMFTFNESVSFVVNCDTQEEIDHYWNKLTAGGSEVQCGWLKDKFGLSWQVVPAALGKMASDPDKTKSGRMMQALMKMKKLDITALEKAFNNE